MVRIRLPPMKALMALEQVVRHGSVTAAADALCVTHGAVSKQLGQLEAVLGFPLFSENRRGMVPTAGATTLARGVEAARRILETALDEASTAAARAAPVEVLAPATFAMRWLIPRLPGLHRPGLDLRVRVRPTHTPDSWTERGYDVAIRRGGTLPADRRTQPLFCDTLGLVAAPTLLADGGWRQLPLLDSETRPGELTRWLAAAGLRREHARIEVFEHYYIALEAALAGQGAIVAPLEIVAALLARGDLVEPCRDIRVPGESYMMVFGEGRETLPAVRAFVAWLGDRVAEQAAPLACEEFSQRVDQNSIPGGARAA